MPFNWQPQQQATPQYQQQKEPFNQQHVYKQPQQSQYSNSQSANTSGAGDTSILPAELRHWNWGGFLSGWIWGIGNNVWISFLTLVPFINFIFSFVLGAKGNEWAWKNKRWNSIEHFQHTQKLWARWCFGLTVAYTILIAIVVAASGISSIAPSIEPNVLINKDASQLVLAIDDFGSGWTRLEAKPTTKTGAQSAYYVYYHQGAIYPPVVTNTVAVYSSTEQAKQVYNAEKPSNVSLKYPNIGNECFYNEAIEIRKQLVFRRNNVVVWVSLLQNMFGDAEQYARKVERKIVP